MTGLASERAFKRALIASAVLHTLLLIMIVSVPSLPRPAKKAMTYYVNFGGLGPGPGGGTGGSGGGGGVRTPAPPPPEPTITVEATPVAKKESLRDLTIPQKAAPEPAETKRYPVEKPKREPKQPPEKKAVISKPEPGAKAEGTAATGDPAAQSGTAGAGLRIGGLGDGAPGTGGGTGGGFGGGGGGGNFPFAYYLGFIMDKVSANWFTSATAVQSTGLLTVQVFFRIQRNGQITDLRVEQSSGNPMLDMNALRAVQQSVPFPPLPSAYEDRYLGVHLVFEHQR